MYNCGRALETFDLYGRALHYIPTPYVYTLWAAFA